MFPSWMRAIRVNLPSTAGIEATVNGFAERVCTTAVLKLKRDFLMGGERDM